VSDLPHDGDSAAHRAAVQGLFVQHSPALRGFVLALVRDFSTVDDVIQETFVLVTAKAAEFQLGSNFQAWVRAIARFKILEHLRRSSTQRLSDEVIEALAACAPDTAGAVGDDRRLELLGECLQGLGPKAREAIELRYTQAHKPPEIARRIGWTVDAVYVALSRARTVLRNCVEEKLAREAKA
jgi:RNA polymerase sigma-70 factor (ECF subfamily)